MTNKKFENIYFDDDFICTIQFFFVEDVHPTTIVQSLYSSQMTQNSPAFDSEYCLTSNAYYECIQINVIQSGSYTLSSISISSGIPISGYLYEQHYNSHGVSESLPGNVKQGCLRDLNKLKIITELQRSMTYILTLGTSYWDSTNNYNYSILVSGPNNVTFNYISKSNKISSFFN